MPNEAFSLNIDLRDELNLPVGFTAAAQISISIYDGVSHVGTMTRDAADNYWAGMSLYGDLFKNGSAHRGLRGTGQQVADAIVASVPGLRWRNAEIKAVEGESKA